MWGVMVLSLDLREIQFLPSYIMPLAEYHTHFDFKKNTFFADYDFLLVPTRKEYFFVVGFNLILTSGWI